MNGSASAARAAPLKLNASARKGVCGRFRTTRPRCFHRVGVAISDLLAAIDSLTPRSSQSETPFVGKAHYIDRAGGKQIQNEGPTLWMCNNQRPIRSRMRRSLTVVTTILLALFASALPLQTLAAAGADGSHASGGNALDPLVLVGVAAMLIVAKLGGEVFERVGQPAVLGELIAGIIIGNLTLVGFHKAELLRTNEVVAALAQIGVILLLFE